ncbi:kinase-like protein [Auricularia subglabra TFB-10046 SS5]|nr:kinase-like protein [Auricularia subglabra TFB-10046 SS5]
MAAPAPSSQHRAPMTPDQAALAAQRSLSQPEVGQHGSRVHRSNGELLVNHFRVTHTVLGIGQHGKVKEGFDIQNNVKVAIKIVKRKSRHKHLPREAPLPASGRPRVSVANNIGSTENKIRKEIAIMKKCDHHHVVRLLEVIDDPMEKKIYMVLEYMEGGEIKWRTREQKPRPTLTVGQTRRTFRDVVLGLEYLHYQGIIHRDIKPSNLLYSADRSNVKISDFGVSHFSYAQRLAEAGSAEASLDNPLEEVLMDESDLSKTAGSPAFFAPELCYQGEDAGVPGARQDPRHRITKAIDIWALGITLFCLLFGRPPLDADTEYQLYQLIPREELVIPEFMGCDQLPTGGINMTLPPDDVGTLAVDMLRKLLVKDPTKRIEIQAIKRHPWVIRDVPNADDWLVSTNPAQHALVEVTKQDAEAAIRPNWRTKVAAFLRPHRTTPAAGSSAPQSSAGPSRQNSSVGSSSGAGLERSRPDKSPKRTQTRRERFLPGLSSSHASVQDAAKSSPNLNDAVGRSPRPGSSRRPNEAPSYGPPQAAPGSPSLSERSLSPGLPPPGSPGPESRRPSRLGGILKGFNGLRRRPKSELVPSMSSGVMVRSSSDGTTEAPPRSDEPLSADSRSSSWTDDAEGDYGNVVHDSGSYSDDRGFGLGLYPRRSDDSNGTGDSSSRSSDYGDPRTRQVGYVRSWPTGTVSSGSGHSTDRDSTVPTAGTTES